VINDDIVDNFFQKNQEITTERRSFEFKNYKTFTKCQKFKTIL